MQMKKTPFTKVNELTYPHFEDGARILVRTSAGSGYYDVMSFNKKNTDKWIGMFRNGYITHYHIITPPSDLINAITPCTQ